MRAHTPDFSALPCSLLIEDGAGSTGPRETDHFPFGHSRVATSDSPVSSKLFTLERIIGQPFDTAPMNFESGVSIS